MITFFTTSYEFTSDRNDVIDGEAISHMISFDGNPGVTFFKDNCTDKQWLILLNRARKYFTIYGQE